MSDKDDKNGDKNNVLPFRNKKGEKINLDDMITFKSSPKTTKEIGEELKKSQTAEFVEGVIDDMAIMLIKNFVDLAMKVDRPSFYADLAILTDIMRGMIYRDFELPHPAQKLADKMVVLNTNRAGTVSAKLNYANVLDVQERTNRPIPNEVKNELKDINDSSIQFDPDGDLND